MHDQISMHKGDEDGVMYHCRDGVKGCMRPCKATEARSSCMGDPTDAADAAVRACPAHGLVD